jgi:hypothetical protein
MGSVHPDAAGPDWRGPFCNLALDECREVFRRLALGYDRRGADVFQPFLRGREIFRRRYGALKLVGDISGRSPGQENREPDIGFEIRQTLLLSGCKVW